MRKKILLIITKSNWGGAQRYVYDLATSLPPESFDCVVVLGGNGVLKEKLERKNIRTISLSSLQRDINIKKEFSSFKDLFMILRKEKPDIIHVNSSKAGGISSFWGRILGTKKIVFTAHAWAFNENRNTLSRFLITFFHWLTVMLAHETIAVSDAVREQVSHLPFIGPKIRTIHLSIDSPHFFSREESRRVLEISVRPEDLVVGTIAELHPVKGLNFAIDGIAYLAETDPQLFRKISYFVIGEGEEKENLMKLIFEKKLEDKIFLKGWLDEASRYLQAFDLFLLPSLSEALGYVLLEAGLAKIPVLASNVGGIPEIIEDGVTGRLFPRKAPAAIGAAILRASEGPSASGRMADALFNKARTEFNLRQMVQKTIDIYLE